MLNENYKKRLQKLAGIISEVKNSHTNEYGCLMIDIEHPNWNDILKNIDKEDIYDDEPGFGLEKDPHVTILFGFHKNTDIDKIKSLIKDQKLEIIKLHSKGISIFETPDYDVVKFDIICPELHKLNKLMTSNFDYTNDFKDYHPHMTIAYVKKGQGQKYINKKSKKEEFETIKFTYSPEDGKKKIKFNL